MASLTQAITPWIQSLPVPLLFVALVLLPLVGVPISGLWIVVGIRSGAVVGGAYAMLALALNQAIGYWLARRWFRKPIEAWIQKRGKSVPVIPKSDEALWIVLIRITPGMPLFLQNYILGIAEARFLPYMLLSFPLQVGYLLAFISMGQAFKESQIGRGLLAISALVALAVIVLLLRRVLERRK